MNRHISVIVGAFIILSGLVTITDHGAVSAAMDASMPMDSMDSMTAMDHVTACSQKTIQDISRCVRQLYGPDGPYGQNAAAHVDMRPGAMPMTTGDPAQVGAWHVLSQQVPINVVHTIVGPNGKALLVAGSGNNPQNGGQFRTVVWDFATNTFTEVATPSDLFCAGQSLLPDGNVLVEGGTKAYPPNGQGGPWSGDNKAYVFNWSQMRYNAVPNMRVGRWYPSTVSLDNGDKLTASGLDVHGDVTSTVEVYQPATNTWRQLPGRNLPLYANLFLTGQSKLFYTGVHTFSNGGITPGIWDPNTNTWQAVLGLPNPECWDQGAAVPLYPVQLQKIIAFGGGCTTSTSARSAIVDLGASHPAYSPGPSLAHSAMHICGLILPSAEIFKSGGGSGQNANPVLDAEIYQSWTSNGWRQVASPTVPRMYHSSCILMPNGSVATLGSNQGSFFERQIEIYKPWYMFQPNRPTIGGSGGTFQLGHTYNFSYTSSNGLIDAMLIKPSAVTHSTDSDQRIASAAVQVTGTGKVDITMPGYGVTTPPGYYMLVLRDQRNVPSVARWIKLVP